MKKSFIFILLSILFFSSQAEGTYPVKLNHKGEINILAFTNNNRTYPFTSEIFSSLEKELKKETSMNVNVNIQTMDFSSLNEEETNQMINIIKSKHYKNTDIIVVRNLTPFIKKIITAFDNVPVFLISQEMFDIKISDLPKNYIFFRGFHVNIKPTVDVALKCCPKTKEIIVISGISPVDIKWYESALSLGEQYKNVNIIHWRGWTKEKLINGIGALPKNTIVVYMVMTKDTEGHIFVSKDLLAEIKRYSSVPIFSFSSTYLNGSIVGGYINSATKDGKIVAGIISQWFHGKKVDTSVADADFCQYMFDWNELKRWHIKENFLPAESIIINRPASFVQRNSDLIICVIVFTIILSLVLFIILMASGIKIAAKKRHEHELEDKNNKYEIINKEYENLNKELNITNNKLYIEKGKVEKANKLTHEFLHNMSHEIRTPMNGIMGFADLLKNDDIDENQRKRYISIIESSGQQLLHIIDSILEISRLDTKKVPVFEDEICLNDFITELFSVFQLKIKELNIEIHLKMGLPDNDSHIITDKVKLNTILGNLIENAIKFTSKGFIELGYYTENNNLVIYVKDTGVGISSENYKNIFDRFSQEEKELSQKVGGLGLGLSIVKENTELIGGNIRLKSEKGKGTTFYVIIPYKHEIKKAEAIEKKAEKTKETIKKKINRTILIAEDEEINLLYLKELLNYIDGYNLNVLTAENGKEAVKLCHENDIDIILMDVKMPIMNGIEASKKIKLFKPDVPIIVQTAYTMAEDKDLALKSGCDDFVSKPIDKDIFLSVINKYLKLS